MLECFLIWLMSLKRHLKFLCYKKNYLFISIVREVLCPFLHLVRKRQSVTFESDGDIFIRRQVWRVLQGLHSSESDDLHKLFLQSPRLQSLILYKLHYFRVWCSSDPVSELQLLCKFKLLLYMFFHSQNLILH